MAQQQAPQKKGMAIAGMILGIGSIILFWLSWIALIIGIVGLVLSIIGLNKAKKDPANYGGRGMAIAGIICSVIGILIVVIMLVFLATLFASLMGGLTAAA